jgi:starch-binding outer membrane protein, SusD/RagB family
MKRVSNINGLAIILISSVFLLSCSDMLDEVPKNFVSRSNYYQNEADAQGALNGAYSSIGPDFYGITNYLMTELQGDYLNGRGSQAPISIVDQVLNQQNIQRAASNWGTLYSAINKANAVLDNVPQIVNISDDAKQRIVAEAHFLRAIAYFELVRGWGDVPIKTTESTDLSELSAAREPEAVVYQLIIDDAKAAEAALGEVGNETGKASVWAAKMLLADVYLTIEEWDLAAQKADEVITGGPYSLVTVSEPDDFYKIFASETSTEDIMSVHHSEISGSTIPTYIHMGGNYPYNYSSSGFFAWLPDTTSFIGASWDDNDLRKPFNLYREFQNASGQWVPLPSTTPVLFKKFITNEAGQSVYSVPVYRFTEAFLIYAEASARATTTPSALPLERLNMIKRRAYGLPLQAPSAVDYPTGMSGDEFVEAVLQERAYEFLLERRRWWDLKRTGKVKEAFAAVGKTFIDQRMLWPIPESEINNNPAITQQDQNPGY